MKGNAILGTIGSVGGAAESLAKNVFKQGTWKFRIASMFGKAVPSLVVAGQIGAVMGAFGNSAENELVQEVKADMKREFKKFNHKQEQSFVKVEELENLIKEEHSKTRFIDEEQIITKADLDVDVLMQEGNSAVEDYKERIYENGRCAY